MTIKELLKLGEKELNNAIQEESNLKVKMLLSNLLGKNKEYLLINDRENVEENIKEEFFFGIEKLKTGIPIQYIIKKQSFFGRDFFVNENVLIPQPDTEILVEETIKLISLFANVNVLDLCTGSGAIAISIKKYFEDKNFEIKDCENKLNEEIKLKMYASDISRKALEVAKINNDNFDANINFVESNLFENIKEKFDIIVSNPPYIETETMKELPVEVKNEPAIALDGGEDGLYFYREISKQAKNFLKENGYLIFEIGYNQKDAVIKILEENNYKEIYSKKDFGNNDRIVVAKI